MSNPRVLNEAGIKALLEANGYEVPEFILVMDAEEHMALAVVMSNCLTWGAIDAMRLRRVTDVLTDPYVGPWENNVDKSRRLTLLDYNIAPNKPFQTTY